MVAVLYTSLYSESFQGSKSPQKQSEFQKVVLIICALYSSHMDHCLLYIYVLLCQFESFRPHSLEHHAKEQLSLFHFELTV